MKGELTVAVTVGGTLYIKINPDDYDSKEEMLQAAEKDAMLHLDELDKYYVFDSEFV